MSGLRFEGPQMAPQQGRHLRLVSPPGLGQRSISPCGGTHVAVIDAGIFGINPLPLNRSPRRAAIVRRLRAGGAAGGGFEDGEGGALRIGDDGNAADVLEIRGWHVELGANFFGLGGGRVAIGNGEVREPMSGNAWLVMRGRRDTADELFAVFDVPVIVGGVFVFLYDLPTKKVGIELPGAGLVGRTQVGPAKRPMRAGDSGSRILVGLPERENGAGGVL